MKPLELKTFPKHLWRAGLASMPVYDWNGIRLSERNANLASQNKRLTTAELSAEVWRSMYLAEVLIDSDEHRRMMVLRRFATLPHASERNYQ